MPASSSSRSQESDPTQPARTPAVQRCIDARDRFLRESKARNEASTYSIKQLAAEAYCAAMPDLAGSENIRDFIACTSYGMVNGLIDAIEGSKFLYAAQVASGVLRHELKEQKRPAA